MVLTEHRLLTAPSDDLAIESATDSRTCTTISDSRITRSINDIEINLLPLDRFTFS